MVSGEDATRRRVYELTTSLDIAPDDVKVFAASDELDARAETKTVRTTHDHIYAVTETNVDGCGGDATEYVAFDADLTDDQVAALRDSLAAAHEAPGDPDTADCVELALDAFKIMTGIDGIVVSSPIRG